MIENINSNPSDWKKTLYIAKKLRVDLDDENNEIVVYDTPQGYQFNYQPVSSYSEIAEFGERVEFMQKAVIPISYKGIFKEFDVAYLDGATPTNEGKNGSNANYVLLPPRNGNSVINIYFERLTGK